MESCVSPRLLGEHSATFKCNSSPAASWKPVWQMLNMWRLNRLAQLVWIQAVHKRHCNNVCIFQEAQAFFFLSLNLVTVKWFFTCLITVRSTLRVSLVDASEHQACPRVFSFLGLKASLCEWEKYMNTCVFLENTSFQQQVIFFGRRPEKTKQGPCNFKMFLSTQESPFEIYCFYNQFRKMNYLLNKAFTDVRRA